MVLLVPGPDDAEPGDAIRAKWSWDGASTLEEAAACAERAAVALRALAEAGWELEGPVSDDHGFLVRGRHGAGTRRR